MPDGTWTRPRILICGGRDFDNKELLFQTMDDLCLKRSWILPPDEYGNWLPDVYVIAGGARGADELAIEWSVINWCRCKEYKADWDKHKKAAGPIRNQLMLDDGKPDLVVAFPGGTGTADMIRRTKKVGIELIEVKNDKRYP